MPLKTRIIPILLWDQRGLCKPIAFQRPGRFVGSLMSAALLYENRTCDELILLDIDATPQGRGPRFEEIKQFTSKLFCPVTVGGGVRSLDDIRGLLNAGADKVVLRTGASRAFISEASKKFGAQCITIAMDYGLRLRDVIPELARNVEKAGAGEIILTNMDGDGVQCGYEINTLTKVCGAVNIPVIANGGCRTPTDMLMAIQAGAHAVAASSMFLYSNITPQHCKEYLSVHGVPVRIET
jgi:cyclase